MNSKSNYYQTGNKPMEIYAFIDPFCIECFSLTPIIKKLQLEYGDYFTLRYVLCGKLISLNKRRSIETSLANLKSSKKENHSLKPLENTPHLAAISIKAAELQGKNAGIRFIRRLQELFFIENADISEINVIQQCAIYAGLDIEEFIKDLYSHSAAKAFQCDLKISTEMEIDEMPALVFFNENIEDEGIKVTGLYAYNIYVHILKEMMEEYPKPAEKPPLEFFLSINPIVGTQDLALIYDQSIQEVEKQMKKLQLQQKVQKIKSQHGSFWKYNKNCQMNG